MPSTNCFWKIRYRMSIGMTAMTAPASEPDEEEPHAAILTAIVEARRIAIALFIIVFSSHVFEKS